MKKCMSVFLALVMALALAVPAFADQTFTGSGSGQVGITAGYQAATDNKDNVDKIYTLTLTWEQTGNLVYNAGKTTYTWKQDSLSYDSTTADKGWSGATAVTITATNRSNAPMDVSCAQPLPVQGLAISGSYANGKSLLELGTAATGGFETTGEPQSASAVYNIASSDMAGDTYKGGNIGTITVTVTAK